jgi:hypothetical protein
MRSKSLKLTVVVLLFSVASVMPIALLTNDVESTSFEKPGPTLYFEDTWYGTKSTGFTVVVRAKVFNLTDTEVPDPNWFFYTIPLGNLWSVRLNFTWDPTILQYVNHTKMMPVETYPNGILHTPINVILEELDDAAGTYHLSASSSSGATVFNNPGASNTIFEMTFNVIGPGWSPLSWPSGSVSLADDGMKPIGVDYGGNDLYIYILDGLAKRPGDTDGDHDVDYDDFIALAGAYGTSTGDAGYDPNADFDEDGEVNYDDFIVLAGAYGT